MFSKELMIFLLSFKFVLIRNNKEIEFQNFPPFFYDTIHMLLTAMANKVSYQLCLYIHLTYTKIHTNKCINTVDTGT